MGSVREGDQFALVGDQHHGLRLPCGRIASHSGRVGGHTGQRQAYRIGAIGQQSEDGLGRHMPFEDVAVEERRVAGPGTAGNTLLLFESRQVGVLGEFDFGS